MLLRKTVLQMIKTPVLAAEYCVMRQSKRKVATIQKSFIIKLLVSQAQMKERPRMEIELAGQQNYLTECHVGGRHFCF